jgi:ABC-type Fe3+/spermidine/putrescine transport system ATPase subunit
MSVVEVRHLVKRYGDVAALDDVSISFRQGEFFGLLGPSGSGKTTLLRAIAGFVVPDRGEILFDGERMEQVPVHKRGIGMVFQNYALFPHMSVAENILFGLSVRGETDSAKRLSEMLRLVQLEGLEARRPRELSGGQQQRVALARALITSPRVLLLDEPLGALDRRLRQEMQVELKRIQRETGITAIFVTHDQEEALSLSDRVGIIGGGKLIQIDEPRTIYERPRNLFAARFLGDANLLTDGRHIIRPEKLLISSGKAPRAWQETRKARVMQAIYSGPSVTYRVACDDFMGGVALVFSSDAGLREGSMANIGWNRRDCIRIEP